MNQICANVETFMNEGKTHNVLIVKSAPDSPEGTPRLSIQILRQDIEPNTKNIWDYLNQLPVQEVAYSPEINRHSIEIGKVTRRGCGDVILTSQSFLDGLDRLNTTHSEEDRKYLIQMILNHYQVVITSDIPENEAIIAYKGSTQSDAGMFTWKDENGDSVYREHPEFHKWIHRLKIKE